MRKTGIIFEHFHRRATQVAGCSPGVLIGAIISILLSLLAHTDWADVIGVAAIAVFAILGFYFGQALDVRDELRDLTE
jgi:hypothetical protein